MVLFFKTGLLICVVCFAGCTDGSDQPSSSKLREAPVSVQEAVSNEEEKVAIDSVVPSDELLDEFYEAIFNGNWRKVDQMVTEGFPASIEPDSKVSPLVAAIMAKNAEIFEYLSEAGANIHSPKDNLMERAASEGLLDIIKYMVNKGVNPKNNAALRAAGAAKQYDTAEYLLSVDANQDLGDASGKQWILFEAVRRSDFSVLDQLYLNPDDINANDCEGETPLIIAINSGSKDMVTALLQKGADKTKPETFDCGDDTSFGRTPKQIATEMNNHEIVELLK